MLYYRINDDHEYDSVQDKLFRNSHMIINMYHHGGTSSHRRRYHHKIKEMKRSKGMYSREQMKEKQIWRIDIRLPDFRVH